MMAPKHPVIQPSHLPQLAWYDPLTFSQKGEPAHIRMFQQTDMTASLACTSPLNFLAHPIIPPTRKPTNKAPNSIPEIHRNQPGRRAKETRHPRPITDSFDLQDETLRSVRNLDKGPPWRAGTRHMSLGWELRGGRHHYSTQSYWHPASQKTWIRLVESQPFRRDGNADARRDEMRWKTPSGSVVRQSNPIGRFGGPGCF